MKGSDLLDARVAAFLAVTEEGSFSAAARCLYVSQPAVSQQVKALERDLGVELFDRSGYRPVLTDAGRAFAGGLIAIVASGDDLIRALGAQRHELMVGFTGASQNRDLLQFMNAFRRDYPDIVISFQKDSFDGCRDHLMAGETDCCFGIVNTFRDLPNVHVEELFDYEICAICSHDNPLAALESVGPADLAGQPFVVLAPEYGRLFYHDFMDALHADGLRPCVSKTARSFDELVFSVSIGEGVALVSRDVVSEREVAVLPLRGSHARSTYVLAWMQNRANPTIPVLAAAARGHFGSGAVAPLSTT